MKKVILAVMLMALALFLILPNLSWAREDLCQAKGAGCQGAGGKARPQLRRWAPPAFSSDKVQKAPFAELADFIESGGPQRTLLTLLPARVSARPMQPGWLLT